MLEVLAHVPLRHSNQNTKRNIIWQFWLVCFIEQVVRIDWFIPIHALKIKARQKQKWKYALCYEFRCFGLAPESWLGSEKFERLEWKNAFVHFLNHEEPRCFFQSFYRQRSRNLLQLLLFDVYALPQVQPQVRWVPWGRSSAYLYKSGRSNWQRIITSLGINESTTRSYWVLWTKSWNSNDERLDPIRESWRSSA